MTNIVRGIIVLRGRGTVPAVASVRGGPKISLQVGMVEVHPAVHYRDDPVVGSDCPAPSVVEIEVRRPPLVSVRWIAGEGYCHGDPDNVEYRFDPVVSHVVSPAENIHLVAARGGAS